jgi:hypothetical protein
MKRFLQIVLVLMVVFAVTSMPAYAERGGHDGHERRGEHFEHRGGHGEFGLFVGPGWEDPYYPYYPPYESTPVIVEPPQDLYVQPNPQAEAPDYWYFCQETQGYYPYVKECPKGWMKVVPSAPK